jgi:hypothetical protein
VDGSRCAPRELLVHDGPDQGGEARLGSRPQPGKPSFGDEAGDHRVSFGKDARGCCRGDAPDWPGRGRRSPADLFANLWSVYHAIVRWAAVHPSKEFRNRFFAMRWSSQVG